MDTFYNYLKNRIDQELPGHPAQLKMAPQPNEGRRPLVPPSDDVKMSSVLILLYDTIESGSELLLTLRTETLPTHKGQISFPGGRSMEGESVVETALRESKEEVGINTSEVQILGVLTGLYLSNSNNYIYPVVGYIDHRPTLTINPSEVAEAFFVDLETLLKSDNLKVEDWTIRDKKYKVPYWNIHPETPLWGATAMILSEFLTLYKQFKQECESSSGS
jgi:8-oxo-dGTP pyrophosphatase MutT (NUDIX family)